MSPRSRLLRRLARTFLPIILVVIIAVAAVAVLIGRSITRPPRTPYLVTPQTFTIGPILKASDATWSNHDGTSARGWLIRGTEGAPAVILLHRYGADRSWLLNLAVKLNETTNYTVLWPDLRGHGMDPPVERSLFGTMEGDDVTAAIDYLHTLKGTAGKPQIGFVGVYGVELGAYAALDAAKRYPEIRALVLDSVPESPDDLIRAATNGRGAISNRALQALGRWGVKIFTFGKYQSTPSCALARTLHDERVLLLAGDANDAWRSSTLDLAKCFTSGAVVETKKDLPLTGFNLVPATGEQEEGYDRPVIEFLDKALR